MLVPLSIPCFECTEYTAPILALCSWGPKPGRSTAHPFTANVSRLKLGCCVCSASKLQFIPVLLTGNVSRSRLGCCGCSASKLQFTPAVDSRGYPAMDACSLEEAGLVAVFDGLTKPQPGQHEPGFKPSEQSLSVFSRNDLICTGLWCAGMSVICTVGPFA